MGNTVEMGWKQILGGWEIEDQSAGEDRRTDNNAEDCESNQGYKLEGI